MIMFSLICAVGFVVVTTTFSIVDYKASLHGWIKMRYLRSSNIQCQH